MFISVPSCLYVSILGKYGDYIDIDFNRFGHKVCWEVPQTPVHLSLSLLFFMSCSALLVASSLLLIPIIDYFNLRLSEMSHCHSLPRHLSYQPPLTPDLTHLCSDHLHLPISNQASLISTLHSVIHSLFSLPFTAPNST